MITAAAVLTALTFFVSACGTGGTGARDEGPARAEGARDTAESAGGTTVSSPAAARVDAVRLLRSDPRVSPNVKRELKPCAGDEYPVDLSYGELTGGPSDDVVVNVLTCGDAVGIGSYVYRVQGGSYRNVFRLEEPPLYAEIDRGALVVTRQLYEKDDPPSSPSGEEVSTYLWTSDRFVRKYRTSTEYSDAVGGEPTPAPDS